MTFTWSLLLLLWLEDDASTGELDVGVAVDGDEANKGDVVPMADKELEETWVAAAATAATLE